MCVFDIVNQGTEKKKIYVTLLYKYWNSRVLKLYS